MRRVRIRERGGESILLGVRPGAPGRSGRLSTSPASASYTSETQDAPEAPVLEARGVVREYGPVVAVAGLDLELRAGEFLTIFGPNGAGKTSLLRLLAGGLRPTRIKSTPGRSAAAPQVRNTHLPAARSTSRGSMKPVICPKALWTAHLRPYTFVPPKFASEVLRALGLLRPRLAAWRAMGCNLSNKSQMKRDCT